MPQKLQFVWPKDGPKGRSGHRGFFGRMNNVLTNRGPDIFLQRKGSSTPISPDCWSNWDSYHQRNYHYLEEAGPYVSRGVKRYDPHSRRYKTWTIPHDWEGDYSAQGIYPHFTASEWRRMARRLGKGHLVDPLKMGDDWHQDGPKRFRQELDEFWQEAHRIGENYRQGLPLTSVRNPNFRMHQQWPNDLQNWMIDEELNQMWFPRR
ncbi:hypothetical protein LHYA1_G007927 [Lachnellula hyalina]|uniref:Uncharacterized protein n=1 Tax=Lachnellula hyalina TaxID=1316788 RepID=A0A8H8TWE3_9HELO|nr:uncharacterized protein LHYA1_G007927 [Lachnellula hyalina]TVY24312.1 hypothetical protein LHYA1_G007927 [Lachnellula hyalina]